MKKHLYSLLVLFIVTMTLGTIASCSSKEEDIVDPITTTREPNEMEKKLFNTSWKLSSSIDYSGYSTKSNLSIHPQYANSIITLSSEPYLSNNYKYYLNGRLVGPWWIDEKGWLQRSYFDISGFTSSEIGELMSVLLSGVPTISGNTLTVKQDFDTTDNFYSVCTYTKTSTPNLDNNGGSSTYEKPEIGFDSFSASRYSLTVKYRIYNKDKANISSSYIYYGTNNNPSKSVSASVSGVYITATISGLSSGTEYYVKCKATGSGGSTTTDVTKCITNY